MNCRFRPFRSLLSDRCTRTHTSSSSSFRLSILASCCVAAWYLTSTSCRLRFFCRVPGDIHTISTAHTPCCSPSLGLALSAAVLLCTRTLNLRAEQTGEICVRAHTQTHKRARTPTHARIRIRLPAQTDKIMHTNIQHIHDIRNMHARTSAAFRFRLWDSRSASISSLLLLTFCGPADRMRE